MNELMRLLVLLLLLHFLIIAFFSSMRDDDLVFVVQVGTQGQRIAILLLVRSIDLVCFPP
jgi:hypothetical protein